MKITRKQVILLLKNHNFRTNEQTEALNGVLVENGSSFDESFGIKEFYSSKEVFIWLGY